MRLDLALYIWLLGRNPEASTHAAVDDAVAERPSAGRGDGGTSGRARRWRRRRADGEMGRGSGGAGEHGAAAAGKVVRRCGRGDERLRDASPRLSTTTIRFV